MPGAPLTFHKVDELPAVPAPDAMYFIRTGVGKMRVVVTSAAGEPVDIEAGENAPLIFTFDVASQWTVNHNRGRKPAAIALLTPGGVEFDANIIHTSDDQFVVQLNPPAAGQVVVA